MIKALLDALQPWLESANLYRYVMVFDQISFRAISAVIIAFLIVVLLGRRVIEWLVRLKIGDQPEFYNAQINELMARKANVPTMGGILICTAILTVVLLLGDLANRYVLLSLVVLLWMGLLGAADDWLKLTAARRGAGSREGLHAWEKLLFQLGIAALVGVFVYRYGAANAEQAHAWPTLPLVRAYDPRTLVQEDLPTMAGFLFVGLAILAIAGTSNAVNLTDGMDGLAAGIGAICAFALMVLTGIVGDSTIAQTLLMPYIPYSAELAVVAGAMAGASLGFLWYNCAPASVFMGDTGSLALGGLMGYIALVIRQEFMLLLIGAVYFAEMLSVVLQVGYFKSTGGRRIFRCAPIHHHFQLLGWGEQKIVIRFWVVTAIFTALALATIKLR